ncbi:hypothetical protein CCH79_00016421 [Gambusia affinis]|uniref:Uncharacterized protein n=1 Tax=Gambusia affinis TaxID=33528 RepID=A0A315WAN1_GAMAF|nr:hypothetical protein CCH79_00016421 [Gambusia affinis]
MLAELSYFGYTIQGDTKEFAKMLTDSGKAHYYERSLLSNEFDFQEQLSHGGDQIFESSCEHNSFNSENDQACGQSQFTTAEKKSTQDLSSENQPSKAYVSQIIGLVLCQALESSDKICHSDVFQDIFKWTLEKVWDQVQGKEIQFRSRGKSKAAITRSSTDIPEITACSRATGRSEKHPEETPGAENEIKMALQTLVKVLVSKMIEESACSFQAKHVDEFCDMMSQEIWNDVQDKDVKLSLGRIEELSQAIFRDIFEKSAGDGGEEVIQSSHRPLSELTFSSVRDLRSPVPEGLPPQGYLLSPDPAHRHFHSLFRRVPPPCQLCRKWEWLSDSASLLPPCSDASSYYSQFGRSPGFTSVAGRRFKGLLEEHLELLRWPEGVKANRQLSVKGEDGRLYHWILPSFFQLIRDLAWEGREFAIVFRTFGTDLPRVLKAMSRAVNEGAHPLFPDLPELKLRVDMTPGKIRCSKRGVVLSRAEERVSTCDGERGLYQYLSSVQGLGGFQDHFDWWATNGFSIRGGKPLWIDPFDQNVQHVFIDDNIRQNDEDTIVSPKVFLEPGGHDTRAACTAELYDISLVQTDLLRAISDRSYFTQRVHICLENYETLLCFSCSTPPAAASFRSGESGVYLLLQVESRETSKAKAPSLRAARRREGD